MAVPLHQPESEEYYASTGWQASGMPEVPVGEFLRIIWRRKGLVSGVAVLLTFLTFIAVNQMTPLYTANTHLMLDVSQSNVLDIQNVVAGLSPDAAAIESEISVIKSRGLAEKLIEKLHLANRAEFNPDLKIRDDGFFQAINPARLISDSWRAILVEDQKGFELNTAQTSRKKVAGLIDGFLERLDVERVNRSFIISVGFTSQDPRLAAEGANTVADLYIVEQLEAKFAATQRANEWLDGKLQDLRRQLAESDQAVEAYRAKHQLMGGEGVSLVAQQITELTSQLIIARSERTTAEARVRQAREVLQAPDGASRITELLSSPSIERQREQENTLLRREAELSQRYFDRHPSLVSVRSEIKAVREKIRSEATRMVQEMRNEVAVLISREAEINRNLEKLKNEASTANRAQVQLRELQRQSEATRTLYETFLNRFKETTEQKDLQQADARIISRADIPAFPSQPKMAIIVVAAAFLSLLIGCLIAYLIEVLHNGLRGAEDTERLLGLPVLAMQPALRRRSGKNATDPVQEVVDRPTSAFAEAIRGVRTSLLLRGQSKGHKVVLVTSSLPGEGKTTLAASLARLAAASGERVVYVEADLRRPRFAQICPTKEGCGLVELIAGDVDISQALQVDDQTGLNFIPVSQAVPNPMDYLMSDRMHAILKELGTHFDLVVIDSPPLMAVSDARLLTRLADDVIFAVRWEKTPRQVIRAAIRQLREIGVEPAGIVMTMVNLRRHARYNYGDSGYYYGKYKEYYENG